MPRKALHHGGLARHRVRRIQAYLEYLHGPAVSEEEAAYARARRASGVLVLSGALLTKYACELEAQSYSALPPRVKQIDDDRKKIVAGAPPSRAKEQHRRHIRNLLSKYADCLNDPPQPVPLSFSAYRKAVLKTAPELTETQREQSQKRWTAFQAWCDLVLANDDKQAGQRLAGLGFDKYTLPALKAGLKVLKTKRKGRLLDLNPFQSFAAIGIEVETAPAPDDLDALAAQAS